MVRNGLVSSLFRLLLLSFPPSFDCNFHFLPLLSLPSRFFFLLDLAPATMD